METIKKEEQKKINEIEVKEVTKMKKEANEILTTEGRTEEFKKKKQKISISYTIKALGGNIKKLEETKMTTKEENEQLRTLYKNIVERWIGKSMEI